MRKTLRVDEHEGHWLVAFCRLPYRRRSEEAHAIRCSLSRSKECHSFVPRKHAQVRTLLSQIHKPSVCASIMCPIPNPDHAHRAIECSESGALMDKGQRNELRRGMQAQRHSGAALAKSSGPSVPDKARECSRFIKVLLPVPQLHETSRRLPRLSNACLSAGCRRLRRYSKECPPPPEPGSRCAHRRLKGSNKQGIRGALTTAARVSGTTWRRE